MYSGVTGNGLPDTQVLIPRGVSVSAIKNEGLVPCSLALAIPPYLPGGKDKLSRRCKAFLSKSEARPFRAQNGRRDRDERQTEWNPWRENVPVCVSPKLILFHILWPTSGRRRRRSNKSVSMICNSHFANS